MPYQVSMMGWVGSGGDFCGLGWVQKFWVGLGFTNFVSNSVGTGTVCVKILERN